jgi:hypothetical protein
LFVACSVSGFYASYLNQTTKWNAALPLRHWMVIIAFPFAALQAAHPIGALTTMERDAWAKARAELEKDPNNARALKAVDSGIVLPYIIPCLYGFLCHH